MNKDENQLVVAEFLDAVMDVQRTQQWLLAAAVSLRSAISQGTADIRLIPMADYFELQGNRLHDFVKGLDEAPLLEGVAPVVEKKFIDPSMN